MGKGVKVFKMSDHNDEPQRGRTRVSTQKRPCIRERLPSAWGGSFHSLVEWSV